MVKTTKRLKVKASKAKKVVKSKTKSLKASKGSSVVSVKIGAGGAPLQTAARPVVSQEAIRPIVVGGGGGGGGSGSSGSGYSGGSGPWILPNPGPTPAGGGNVGPRNPQGPGTVDPNDLRDLIRGQGADTRRQTDRIVEELRRRMDDLQQTIDDRGMDNNRRIQQSLTRLREDVGQMTDRVYRNLSEETFGGVSRILDSLRETTNLAEASVGRTEDVLQGLIRLGERVERFNRVGEEQRQRIAEQIGELAGQLQDRLGALGTDVGARVEEALTTLQESRVGDFRGIANQLAVIRQELNPDDERAQAILNALGQLGDYLNRSFTILAGGLGQNQQQVMDALQQTVYRVNMGRAEQAQGFDVLRGTVMGAGEAIVDTIVDQAAETRDLARRGGEYLGNLVQRNFQMPEQAQEMRPPTQEGPLPGQQLLEYYEGQMVPYGGNGPVVPFGQQDQAPQPQPPAGDDEASISSMST
jgi:hypothetical protein